MHVPAPSWRSGEEALNDAALRFVRRDGNFVGTGVLVTCDGHALTCHHVIQNRDDLTAIDRFGREWLVRPVSGDHLLQTFDVAVVRLHAVKAGQALPNPAPLTTNLPGRDFQTNVMLSRRGIAHGVPLSGALEASAEVIYLSADGSQYGPSPLLPIRDLKIEPGMSGSPVWDPQQEAVAGLVTVGTASDQNIGGFAVPLAAVAKAPGISDVLAENSRCVARFGIAPNRLALTWVGHRVSTTTTERLIARGIYLREKAIARDRFGSILEAFLLSSKRALPIVGFAGCGKTSLLAHLADTYDGGPLLFLRSADARSNDTPKTVLDRAIAAAVAETSSQFVKFDHIHTLDKIAPAPLVLWDAVNELPFSDLYIVEEWLPELLAAVERAGMKLIFTCRPELFQSIGEAHYAETLFPGPAKKTNETGITSQAGWFLNGFSDDEAVAARKAYQVPPTLVDAITRHPLLLRLAAEEVERSGLFLTRSSVLANYLNRSIVRIAKLTKLPHRLVVDQTIQRLAGEVARSQSGIAPVSGDRIIDRTEILHSLVSENLIEAVSDGFRFVFDEVYEYVLASIIDTQAVVASEKFQDPSLGVSIHETVLSLAMERLIDEGKLDEFRVICQCLVERIQSGDGDRWQLFRVTKTILQFRTPEIDDLKENAVDALTKANADSVGLLVWEGVQTASSLPWRVFKKILYEVVLQEAGYDWREKDLNSDRRARLEPERQSLYGAAKLVAEIMEGQPEKGTALLIEWLSDETRLSYEREKRSSVSEGTVRTFALCMLWIHREKIGIERLFEVLLPAKPVCMTLILALVDEFPRAVSRFLASIPLEDQTAKFWSFRHIWVQIMTSNDSNAQSDIARVASKFYERSLDILLGQELNQAISDVVSFEFLKGLDMKNAMQRLGSTGALDGSTLVDIYKSRQMDLASVVLVAKQANQYSQFVRDLASEFPRIRHLLPLRSLRDLISDVGYRLFLSESSGRMGFENLLYEVGFAEAVETGLLSDLKTLFRDASSGMAFLMYVAFSETGRDEDKAKFRRWLAVEICQSEVAAREPRDLFKHLLRSADLFLSHHDVVANVVKATDVEDLLIAIMACRSDVDVDLLDKYLAIRRSNGAGDTHQLALLDAFAERRAVGDRLFDAAYKTLEDARR
jgi:hypothetical protein